MLKNKHIIVAMIVAPLLGLVAYFATDFFVKEKPHLAEDGVTYRLVAKSNCRYKSGRCSFVNGNFEVTIQSQLIDENYLILKLESTHALDSIKLAISDSEQDDVVPVDMQVDNDQRTRWLAQLTQSDFNTAELRLAIVVDKTFYYAQSELTFLNYEATFKQDFRANRDN